jgi:hypothetical protein
MRFQAFNAKIAKLARSAQSKKLCISLRNLSDLAFK